LEYVPGSAQSSRTADFSTEVNAGDSLVLRWDFTDPLPVGGGGCISGITTYLAERWQQGCTNAAWLTAELRDRGYHGSERSVRRLLHTWRADTVPPTANPPATPKPRQVTSWIIQATGDRSKQDQADLDAILHRCRSLHIVNQLVSDFAGMPCSLPNLS